MGRISKYMTQAQKCLQVHVKTLYLRKKEKLPKNYLVQNEQMFFTSVTEMEKNYKKKFYLKIQALQYILLVVR